MKVHQSPSKITILVVFWISNFQTLHGLTGDADKLGSAFYFYQQSTYPRDCKEIQDQCPSHNSTGVFMIKPDGYLDPFEVYCDSTDDSGGWTVIHRRLDGAINFNRSWESYKTGFGFLSQELWLGNDRISYLTNQKRYQLVVEMTMRTGSFIRLVYDNFRISDDFSNYKLVSTGQYSGVADNFTCCPTNMVWGNCNDICQRTCQATEECIDVDCSETESCVCPDGFFMDGSSCVSLQQCGCYVAEANMIIKEGDIYVNVGCTRKGVCTNGQITWDENYQCGPNEVCEVRDNIRQCYPVSCTDCKDCQEIFASGSTENGLYMIKPTDWTGSAFQVYCNMSDGGGWTVFQRRVDGSQNFDLEWDDYRDGFGNLSHEFWLGNDKLHFLTKQKTYEIRIDLVNRDGAPYYAKFDNFRINDENDNYRLSSVGSYSGTADTRNSPDGIQLTYSLNWEFSTKDRDNDGWSLNCVTYGGCGALCCSDTSSTCIACAGGSATSTTGGGPWWHSICAHSALNAPYGGNVYWSYLPGCFSNIQFTEMKVRPI